MVSVLRKELEGKVGKLKCKTLEVMKNEKQIWNSIMWINHTRPVYMKYCSHDTVYHLLIIGYWQLIDKISSILHEIIIIDQKLQKVITNLSGN